MKKALYLLIALLAFISCKSKTKVETNAVPQQEDAISYFPVTDFIKGQITSIREKKINPLKHLTIQQKIDSSWIQLESLEAEMGDFLHPLIDTANMAAFFSERKFLDQSVNAFTFTYDPKPALPDTFQLRNWDVYVNPEDGKVRRIYMVKNLTTDKVLQLTWQTDQYCKMVTVRQLPGGKFNVEKEEKISWDF